MFFMMTIFIPNILQKSRKDLGKLFLLLIISVSYFLVETRARKILKLFTAFIGEVISWGYFREGVSRSQT